MVNASDILNAKILIVDDSQANVILLERMLHGAGYTCVASTMDPREVCELHSNNRYDLILLDLQMPGMDGFKVMEGLKEIEIDGYLSVLAVTAQPAHKLRALQGGAKDFHATGYNTYRHESLNANSFFNNRTGTKKVPYRYRITGYNVSGPVTINKRSSSLPRASRCSRSTSCGGGSTNGSTCCTAGGATSPRGSARCEARSSGAPSSSPWASAGCFSCSRCSSARD